MSDKPFSIFKRHDRKYFYVKFKNENGNYSTIISTKKTDKQLAEKTLQQIQKTIYLLFCNSFSWWIFRH